MVVSELCVCVLTIDAMNNPTRATNKKIYDIEVGLITVAIAVTFAYAITNVCARDYFTRSFYF